MSNDLRQSIMDNLHFFKDENDQNLQFRQCLEKLLNTIDEVNKMTEEINGFACEYDLDHQTIGNGYHSVVYVCKKALDKTAEICGDLKKKRGSFYFNGGSYQK